MQLVAPAIESGIACIPYIRRRHHGYHSGRSASAMEPGSAVTFVLRDKHGQAVPAAKVTCSVTGPVVLNIDADRRKVIGSAPALTSVRLCGRGAVRPLPATHQSLFQQSG